jgi:hypothetical protein
MSKVEIRDHVIWPKHIHGNDVLKSKLLALKAGALVDLVVDGFRGTWKKMDDGTDGLPMPGIKPVGKARDHWHELQTQRGELVTIKLSSR